MISYLAAGGQYSLNFKLKTNSEQKKNYISVLAGGLAVTQQMINSTQGNLPLKAHPGKWRHAAGCTDKLTFIVVLENQQGQILDEVQGFKNFTWNVV